MFSLLSIYVESGYSPTDSKIYGKKDAGPDITCGSLWST